MEERKKQKERDREHACEQRICNRDHCGSQSLKYLLSESLLTPGLDISQFSLMITWLKLSLMFVQSIVLSLCGRFCVLPTNSHFSPLSPTSSTSKSENVIHLSFRPSWRPMHSHISYNHCQQDLRASLPWTYGKRFPALIKENWEKKLTFLCIWKQCAKTWSIQLWQPFCDPEKTGSRT